MGSSSSRTGARRRNARARAIFCRCPADRLRAPVLLLDEPTAHLDPVSADRVLAALDHQLADRTVIIITHQPPPRDGRTTRVVALDHGRLSPVDAPGEARAQPAGLAVVP